MEGSTYLVKQLEKKIIDYKSTILVNLLKSLPIFLIVAANYSCKRDISALVLASASEEITVSQEGNGKVDILFIVDNSGSMGDDQQGLADNIQLMTNNLARRSLHFNFGATTTDFGVENGAFVTFKPYHITNNPYQDQNCGNIIAAGERVVNSSDPLIEDKMYCKIISGINGSGNEKGQDSLHKALSEPHLSTTNAGFFRNDSFLGIVIISDEKDSSSKTPAQTKAFLDQLTGYDGSQAIRYSVNVIVHQSATACNGATNAAYDGVLYRQLAELTGGVNADICEDFADVVDQISDGIAKAVTEVRLSRPADPETVQVIWKGIDVPKSSTNGFIYNVSRQAVQFSGSYVPSPGDKLSISYDPLVPFN